MPASGAPAGRVAKNPWYLAADRRLFLWQARSRRPWFGAVVDGGTSIGTKSGQRCRTAVTKSGIPLLAIALTLAGLLAYEVLLTRLFSIIQRHHFAYMVISISLLGYGASGTLFAFAQDWLSRHFISAFAFTVVLFVVSPPRALQPSPCSASLRGTEVLSERSSLSPLDSRLQPDDPAAQARGPRRDPDRRPVRPAISNSVRTRR
jgi:hypothetical protein